MKVTALEVMYTRPMIRREAIREQFDIGHSAVAKALKDIQEEIKKGRYSPLAYTKAGGMVWVSYLVLLDYFHYRDRLADKNARKHVPAYEAKEWLHEIGWNEVREIQ
jgi:hypothetical protein